MLNFHYLQKKNIKNIDNNIMNNNDNKNNPMINDGFMNNKININQNIFNNNQNMFNINNQNNKIEANNIENKNDNINYDETYINDMVGDIKNNDEKNFTNKGPDEININNDKKNEINKIYEEKEEGEKNIDNTDNTDMIINKNILNNDKENVINNENIINEAYLYDCTNSMYLSRYVYQGVGEVIFEIYLRNIGKKSWANDSKLLVDHSSAGTTTDIKLEPQNPNEERGYKFIVKDLENYPPGEYKIIFYFWSGGKINGGKIVAKISIKEKDIKKNEIDEYIDKINDFRETFNLSEDEYPNEKLLDILKDNNFNFEDAFSSLFN